MHKDNKIKRVEKSEIRAKSATMFDEEMREKINTEKAKQRKFQDDSIKKIVTDNFIFQIKKKIEDKHTLDDIIALLNDDNSKMYNDVLEVVIRRTESTIKIKDIAAQRKIQKGEEGRLINPDEKSLKKIIERLFSNIVKGLAINRDNEVLASLNRDIDVENR